MKKIALIVIFTLSYFGAEAQSTKGTFQLGLGGLPIVYPLNPLPAGYTLRGNIGYFLSDRWSVGLTPFYGKVSSMESAGVNVYCRYYLINKERWALFAEGGGGVGNLRYEFLPQLNGNMSSFNIGPGFHYLFESKSKNQVAIEFLLQYGRLQNMTHPESTTTGHIMIPTLGVQYFIKK